LKVVGAGFGRTGTTSLKAALERLGFGPCYHMTEVFAHPDHAEFWSSAWRKEPVDWEGVIGNYEATEDCLRVLRGDHGAASRGEVLKACHTMRPDSVA
jgi:hypothetical protein